MRVGLVLLALALVVGVAAWQLYKRSADEGEQTPVRVQARAVAVEIAPVEERTLREVGSFTGSLVAKKYFVVAPKVAGRLERLLVDVGDRVERGQLVAELDDEEYVQQAERTRAELEVAKANVIEARSAAAVGRRELARVETLFKKNIVAEAELDTARARYEAQEAGVKVALAQVSQAEAALKAAEVRLSYTQIQAHWEGNGNHRVVGEKFVDEGAMLAPNAPMVSILDLTPLTAVIHVIERDYSRVHTGREALLSTDAFPGKTFRGEVVRVAPLLRETSRQARVEIETPNPDGALKPGMFVRVEMEYARREKATVVPQAALARRGEQKGVFLVDIEHMTARYVPVVPGITDGDLVEIAEPAISGLVVTLGQHLLEDGSSVILPDEGRGEEVAGRGGPEEEEGRESREDR